MQTLKTAIIGVLAGAIITFSVAGCNRRSSAVQQSRGNGSEGNGIPVVVENVQLRDLPEFVLITGRLSGITDVTMLSETTGRVITLNKQLGDFIEAGAEIGVIDNEVFRIRQTQAEAGLASATAAMETALMNYRSTKQLFESGSASNAEYQQALFAEQAAKAQRDGAAAQLESARKAYDNSRLVAPVSGYITSLKIKQGETIFPNATIASIVNHEKLLLKGGITEQHILEVKPNQNVMIIHNNNEYKGYVRGLGINPMPQSASYPVEIVIDNENKELIPGMVVSAHIQTRINRNIIYTENGNIRTRYDDHYVYTANEQGLAQRTIIIPGRRYNEFTVVEEGLSIGDLLVIEGIDSLDEGIKVNITN